LNLNRLQEAKEVPMKVWLDRDTCTAQLATCLSCFGELMRTGYPNRGCVTNHEDDQSEDITVFMKSEGHEVMLLIPESDRELVAYEGWDKFVQFEPSFRRGEGMAKPD
jgi:hypothetical protein